MNGYKAFWKNKELDVYAATVLEAQQKAAKLFKTKKAYDILIVLCEKDGKAVIHNPAEFGS